MLITTNELVKLTGLSKTTIWRYRQRYSSFPRPIILSDGGHLRWVADEIEEWFLSRRGI